MTKNVLNIGIYSLINTRYSPLYQLLKNGLFGGYVDLYLIVYEI